MNNNKIKTPRVKKEVKYFNVDEQDWWIGPKNKSDRKTWHIKIGRGPRKKKENTE